MITEDYYYRVDPEKRFNCIEDGVLRACRWQLGSYPHKNLCALSKKNPGKNVYRVCFYDTEMVARDHLKEFSSEAHIKNRGVRILTRWPRSAPSSVGFTWSQDDGFDPGRASLFWVLEQPSNTLSSIGIALKLAEVWDDTRTKWVPLFDNYPSLNPNHGATASTTPSTALPVNVAGSTTVIQSETQTSASKLKKWLERFLGKR